MTATAAAPATRSQSPVGDVEIAGTASQAGVAAQILRAELDRRATPRIPAGSIVRFTVDGYQYAALSVGERWYTTAAVTHHLGDRVFESTADFTDRVLARATSIEVATGFSPV